MSEQKIPKMQAFYDDLFLLFLLGVVIPTVSYTIWGIMEIANTPLAPPRDKAGIIETAAPAPAPAVEAAAAAPAAGRSPRSSSPASGAWTCAGASSSRPRPTTRRRSSWTPRTSSGA